MKKLLLTVLCSLSLGSMYAQDSSETDYTKGVFVVNEDWYGHQNSTVNFLTDEGEWHYRVFQTENPGHELGCTSQFGTIYGDRMYIVSKQEKDPGAKVVGSRFVVCDALTMKVIKEFQNIAVDADGNSIADGRSYLPVDEHKGYIGTSNGIWIFNSDDLTIGGQIKGSGNPNDGGYGALYYAQIGTMLRVNDLVFAVHQQDGILVIDAENDTIVTTIKAPVETEGEKEVQRGFGSIVMSKDGTLWASLSTNTNGTGGALKYMYHINPFTLDIEKVDIPMSDEIGIIPNSWYAWTADGFCASKQENKIYWNGYPEQGSWFTGYQICGYDIDNKEFFRVFDFGSMEGDWRMYGTGFRIHPVTDEIYAFLYHNFQDPNHELVRVSTDGELIQEYPMIINYWFPALPVFPDNEAPVVSDELPAAIKLTADEPEYKINLGSVVSDADNMDAAIVKSVASVTPSDSHITATVRNDSLVICSSDLNADDEAEIALKFNSNGKIVMRNIMVTTGGNETGIDAASINTLSVYPNPAVTSIRLNTEKDAAVKIYTTGGRCVREIFVGGGESIDVSGLAKGMYLVRIETADKNETVKLIKI